MVHLHHVGADAPGLAAPAALLKDEPHGLADTEGFKVHEGIVNTDCAETDAYRIAVSTMSARAALAGHQQVQLADGSLMASRWGMLRRVEWGVAR